MSRETYALWKNEGSPRQGLLFEMKNRAKARFKGAMRMHLGRNHLPKTFCVKMTRHFVKKLN